MTLSAEGRSLRFKELPFARSVGIMAHLAPCISYGLMGIGFQKVRFSVGMTRIADRVHPVPRHGNEIGTVGVMARATHILSKRGMDVFRLLQILGLCVAGEADISFFHDQELLVFCCMGSVAGQTSLPARDRCMAKGFFRLFVRMASETELIAFLDNQLRVLRGMRIMAGKTHPATERRMFDRASGLQRRRVMALETEVASLLCRIKWFLGPRGIVARIAAR